MNGWVPLAVTRLLAVRASEEADRAAWLDSIRQRLQLVTIDDGMPPPREPVIDVWLLSPYDPRGSVLL